MPDLLGLVREANILCSSTTPTLPFGLNTAAEHVPMIVLNHGGSMAVAGDLDLAGERIHPATMAAEGPLHDLGRDPDHQLGLAGDGPDHGDRPADPSAC